MAARRDGAASGGTRRYRDIWADYDRDTIVVYQAYNDEIADAALAAGTFVAPFSFTRMTWIKPSFCWLMARSGWGTKSGQRRVLGVRIARAGWESALSELHHRSIQLGIGREAIETFARSWVVELTDLTNRVTQMRDEIRRGMTSRVRRHLPTERRYVVDDVVARRLGMGQR